MWYPKPTFPQDICKPLAQVTLFHVVSSILLHSGLVIPLYDNHVHHKLVALVVFVDFFMDLSQNIVRLDII